MQTIFISGSDTGIGKTWVTQVLVRAFSERAVGTVQVVKPVETGVTPNAPQDAPFAASGSTGAVMVSHHTCLTFEEPIAPLDAARLEGRSLSFDELLGQVLALPSADYRLVEGAGGLAVPLAADGRDWADFAAGLNAALVILVVADRLGAIHQARTVAHYAATRSLPFALILNQIDDVAPSVRASNHRTLTDLGLPLLATLKRGECDLSPDILEHLAQVVP